MGRRTVERKMAVKAFAPLDEVDPSAIYMTGECVPKISPSTAYSQSRNVFVVFGFFTLKLQRLILQTSLRHSEGFNLAVFAMTACGVFHEWGYPNSWMVYHGKLNDLVVPPF